MAEPVVEFRKKKLDRHSKDDPKTEGVDQSGQAITTLELTEGRTILVSEQVADLRGGEPHPPSIKIQTVLVSLLFLHECVLTFQQSQCSSLPDFVKWGKCGSPDNFFSPLWTTG